MEKLLERLPDLNLASDEDSDDSGDKSAAVFSRSAHLKSLGVELSNPKETVENETESKISTKETNLSKVSSLQVNNNELPNSDVTNIVDSINTSQNDWAKFKSEFSESLHESEKTMTSLDNGDLPLQELKQQLLVSAILAMHDNTETPGENAMSPEISKSPSKVRRRLVSLNSLETIHESELDKLLEGDCVLSEDKDKSTVEDNQTRPSAPRLVWEKEDTDQLLRDLEKMSKANSTRSVPNAAARTNDWRNPISTESRTVNGNKDKGPIFLDLRPGPDENKAVKQNERSTSDDDDSDDAYAWITQRKHIKHTLSTSHPLAIDSSQTPQPILKMAAQSLPKQKVESSTTQTLPTDSSVKNTGIPSTRVTTKPINTPAVAPRHAKCGATRQRNSSSLTLSSSLSDGEANVFEMPSVNESKSQPTSHTKSSSTTSSPTKSKKSKKQSKKSSKKSRKEKDTSAPKKDSAKSAQRKLARALVLQRIRNDSLTTSSDEEHCLTPTETGSSKLSSSLSSCDALAHQESEEDLVMDTEKLKLRLQKIIHAKKPPAQFVTPGTSTVFHEEVSFDPQPSSTDPAHSTDAMLVFPLSEHGLISLPTEIEEEGDLEVNVQTQLSLHLLILTWLTGQVAKDYNSTAEPTESTDLVLQELEDDSIPLERHDRTRKHFHITGLLQTIYDGRPSLLVGVCVDAGLKSSSKKQGKWFQVNQDSELINTVSSKLTTRLHGVSLNAAMQSVIKNDRIRTLVNDKVLEDVEQIGELPLTSFLSVQEDTAPLNTLLSFYWHSGYHISSLPSNESLRSQSPVSTTVTTLSRPSLGNYPLVFTTLQSAYDNAFYLAGLRTIYTGDTSSDEGLTMALALRGSDSLYRWLDIVGPEDTNLAKITDPDSLNAKFGDSQVSTLQCVRTPYFINSTLAKWFGGRACLKTGSVLGISDPRTKFERRKRQRVRFSESESEDGLPSPSPDVTFPPLVSNRPGLVAQAYTKVLLTVAPLVPPSLYGSVLSTCNRMGFDVLGMKRIRLNSKRAGTMHIPNQFLSNFTPSSTPPSPAVDFVTHPLATEYAHTTPPSPSLVLYLGSENGKLHSLALKKAICSDLDAIMKANDLQVKNMPLSSPESFLFTTEMSQEISKVLGSFSLSSAVSSSLPKLHEQRKCSGQCVEELCFVAVPQCNSLPKLVDLLNKVHQLKHPMTEQSMFEQVAITHSEPSSNQHDKRLGGVELLGFKTVPLTPRFHAKRLCPLPNTDSSYQTAVNILSDSPVSLLLFRGLDCNRQLSALIKLPKPKRSLPMSSSVQQQLDIIVSQDFEEAFNLSSIFFSDKEMFCDSTSHDLALCMPPSWQQDSCILQDLQTPPSPLLSVVRVKLSQSRMVVKVLDRLWRDGFKLAAMKAVEIKNVSNGTNVKESVEGGEACLVVCVLRVNAVWQLKHCLCTLTGKPTTVRTSAIHCADTFFAAISQVKQYFPEGICCEVPASSTEYKIQPEMRDSFDGMILPERCLCSPSSTLLGYTSPLLETTVLVLPPSVLLDSSYPSTSGCVEVIDFLTQSGFEIQGLKMATLSLELAGELLALCDHVDNISVDELSHSPCLVMVVRRDNAASCCRSIFKSALLKSYKPGQGLLEKLLSQLIVPSTAQQATGALRLFKVSV